MFRRGFAGGSDGNRYSSNLYHRSIVQNMNSKTSRVTRLCIVVYCNREYGNC